MSEPLVPVLYICAFADIVGGGQLSLLLLIENLDRSRFRPIIMLPGPGEMSRRAAGLGAEVHFASYPVLKSPRLWRPLLFVLGLARLIRTSGVKIVHSDQPDLALSAALAARLASAHAVFHARVCERHRLDPLLSMLNDALVCVSRAAAERFRGAGNPRISVVYNGVDLRLYAATDKARAKVRLGLAPETPVVGYAGQLSRAKGLDILLRAFALVRRELPGARLVLLGRGPDEGEMLELAAELGIKECLLCPGFTQRPENIIPAFDILLFATRFPEGFSRVLIEAMACGIPAVASARGGNLEAVSDGQNGFLIHEPEPRRYAQKALQLLKDRALYDGFSVRAAAAVKERFDAQETSRRIHSIYGELLAEGTRAPALRRLYFGIRRPFIRAGAALLPRRERPRELTKILVLRNDGLGDLALSLPFLESLRLSHPAARITVLCHPEFTELLRGLSLADRFVAWSGSGLRLLPGLRNEGFDLAIDCVKDSDLGRALWCRASGARFCQGFECAGSGLLLDAAVAIDGRKHFADELGDLAAALGLRPPRPRPILRLPRPALSRARTFLLSRGLRPSDRLLFLHPGGRYPSQRWPAARLARAALQASREHACRIVVAAGPKEARELAEMRKVLPDAVYLEHPDILELAAAVALSGVFAGNNSGALHLACALGVPSVSTLGPTDAIRWRPLGEACVVLDAADYGAGHEIGQIPEAAFAAALSKQAKTAKTMEARSRACAAEAD